MNDPLTVATGGSSYNPRDIMDLISGVTGSATQAVGNAAQAAASKKELRQVKKRTFADLLAKALKRDTSLFRMGQEHADDTNDYQSQAMQDVARGFADSLRISTRRRG